MANITIQTGHGEGPSPGTINQTGNSAPKYPYKRKRIGRVVSCGILAAAYYLKFTDDRMGRLRDMPTDAELWAVVTRTFPWLKNEVDTYRQNKAAQRGYTGPIEWLGPADIRNRLLYFFTHAGKSNGKKRQYGLISDEHPESIKQARKLRVVWRRCSSELEARMISHRHVSKAEAYAWGVLSGEQLDLFGPGEE